MRLAAQPKKSTTGEVRRAVQQMEAQLRATRQDALQLATAVVRLEKEKAVLQTQLSGQDSGVSLQRSLPPSPPPWVHCGSADSLAHASNPEGLC